MEKNRKIVYLSLLVTFGIVLHVIENTIPVPFPVPGAKLGMANIISLITIVMYGPYEGLVVNILRCIIGALLSGSISGLFYSLAGALFSTLAMIVAYRYFGNTFSLIGISIIGGVVHNFAQVTMACILLSTWGIYIYLPFLMIAGLFTGIFTGIVATFTKSCLTPIFKKRLNKNVIGEV